MSSIHRTLSIAAFLISGSTMACSCFGPQTFCGVLAPPQPNPEWWLPDAIVLGVKLGDYEHGMDVKIVQSFAGELVVDQVIRVWGDCGNLCRHYPETWNVGDTVVWSFKYTDLAGNGLCPGGGEYEMPGDYMISICGVYYLDYSEGMVIGPITVEGTEMISLEELEQLVNGCLSTDISEGSTDSPLSVRDAMGGPFIALSTKGPVELDVLDTSGRSCLTMHWSGAPLQLAGLPAGAYMITIRSKEMRVVRRVAIF